MIDRPGANPSCAEEAHTSAEPSAVAEPFRLGESWPDWWGRVVSINQAITGNFDGRWRGGPDYALIRRHSGGITVKAFGELISPEDFQ